MPPIPDGPGVYCWTNLTNGKRYIGSSAQGVYRRRKQWLQALRGGRAHNVHFQAAWNKYGEASFRFSVLERCETTSCVSREQYWIDHYQVCNRNLGYNLSPTAGSCLGCRHSTQTKMKVSKARKGTKMSVEARAAMSASSRRYWDRPGSRQRKATKDRAQYADPAMKARLVAQA